MVPRKRILVLCLVVLAVLLVTVGCFEAKRSASFTTDNAVITFDTSGGGLSGTSTDTAIEIVSEPNKVTLTYGSASQTYDANSHDPAESIDAAIPGLNSLVNN